MSITSLPTAKTKAVYQPIPYTFSRDGSFSGINLDGPRAQNPHFLGGRGVYYSQKLKTIRESQSKPELAEQSLTSGAKLGQILKVQKDLKGNSPQPILGGRDRGQLSTLEYQGPRQEGRMPVSIPKWDLAQASSRNCQQWPALPKPPSPTAPHSELIWGDPHGGTHSSGPSPRELNSGGHPEAAG